MAPDLGSSQQEHIPLPPSITEHGPPTALTGVQVRKASVLLKWDILHQKHLISLNLNNLERILLDSD